MASLDDALRALVRDEMARVLAQHDCRCTHSSPVDPDGYLSTIDAAKDLGVSPKTLANWRALRRGPEFVRQGRVVRYQRSALTAWLAKRG